MKRVKDWPSRLAAFVAERERLPFTWGANDCCSFANAGLMAQGAPDMMADIRPYKTARGAAGALSRIGGLEGAARKRLHVAGFREVDIAFAGRGCPVLANVRTPGGAIEPAMGIVGLDGASALFPGADGLTRIGSTAWITAWVFD